MEIYAVDTVSLPKRNKLMTRKKVVKKDPFAEVFGIWVDREIDAATLRRQTWGIEC